GVHGAGRGRVRAVPPRLPGRSPRPLRANPDQFGRGAMMFRLLDRTLDTLLFVVLAAMGAIVATNVFCRFVLNFSIYWGDEAAQALLVWLTFLGAAVAVRDRSHYSFDYLARTSSGPRRFAIGVVSRSIT